MDASAEARLVLREDRGGIATLTLNRPDQLNALSEGLMRALQRALDAIAGDESVRVVVLRGAGRGFCAGHDLREMQGARREPDGGREAYQSLFAQCSRLMTTLPRLPQPVIAEVHGIATAAGCQLVASCDLAVAAESARFGVNGVNIGLFCSTPMVALSRNVGRKKTFELLTTGDFLGAAQAAEAGLVNRVVADDRLGEETRALAAQIAGKLGSAVRVGKRAFHEQLEMPLDQAYAYTARVIAENMLHPETAEGVQAFLEKRRPAWAEPAEEVGAEAPPAEADNDAEALRRAKQPEAAYVHPSTPPAIDAEAFERLQAEHGTRSSMMRALEAEGVSVPMIAHTLAHYGVLNPRSAYSHTSTVLGHD
ncbi:MAG TPA: enoyl-CoA hydratase [Thermohalobaculum sp.]|nr:enoyl-CoA hydratase [Thermohalobaculum sp.]